MIQKGKVSAILDGGKFITATPYVGETVTTQLTVPHSLIDALPIGTPILYTVFDDNTGVVLGRMDGYCNNQGTGTVNIKAYVDGGVCKVCCE